MKKKSKVIYLVGSHQCIQGMKGGGGGEGSLEMNLRSSMDKGMGKKLSHLQDVGSFCTS